MSTSSPSRPSTPSSLQPSVISHPAHKLLARAQSPESATRLFNEKVRNKPLLLQPTNFNSSGQDKRALRRQVRERQKAYHRSKQRPRPLSAREKREKGLYKLQPDECRYEVYRGLNQLWKGYLLEILGFTNDKGELDRAKLARGTGVSAASHGSSLATMDFHGMELEVVRAKDTGRVGLKGIVVRETKYTMVVVCPGDKVRTMMKGGAVFRVVVDLSQSDNNDNEGEASATDRESRTVERAKNNDGRQLIFELHGDQLEIRPIERATKKFKWKPTDYL